MPVSAAYNYDDDLTDIRALVTTESRVRGLAIHSILERLDSMAQFLGIANIQQHDLQRKSIYTTMTWVSMLRLRSTMLFLVDTIDAVEAITATLSDYATTQTPQILTILS